MDARRAVGRIVTDPVLTHETVRVNGVRLHYVVAGSGEPVILLPGWPQSWFAWRRVIPELVAADRTVYVVDPRGFGGSELHSGGGDVADAAADVSALASELFGPAPVDVIAHDVGSWIAHAWAVAHPDEVKRLVLVDAGIPGVTALPGGIPSEAANIRSWHFGFNRLPDLPELLIAGREREYLEWLFESKSRVPGTFDDAALDEYSRVLSAPGALTAGMDYYRSIFSAGGLARSAARGELPLRMPVLTVGADAGVGSALFDTMASRGDRVTGVVIEDCGHYIPEERPVELARAIIAFWAANP
jgi:pimeloyl-ACP methyl ester carboxylesterase